MKSQIKNYLSITKKEWNGLVVLVVLIVLVSVAPYIYRLWHKDTLINFNQFDKDAAMFAGTAGYQSDSTINSKDPHPTLFNFNPNHLPDKKWLKLGLSHHQIDVLKHYEAKGGHFYRKEDVQKIYSITTEDYKRLEPYIQLPGDDKTSGKTAVTEINHADSAALITLKGIGPAYAMRIIRYRDKLGGFYKKEQLKEVFGIDEEHYLLIDKQVKVNPASIKKLNINKATFDDLRRYPYLSYKQINAIISYRNEHGDYDSFDDLKDIAILDEATLRKIRPYWVFK